MAVTILEALFNSEYNLGNVQKLGISGLMLLPLAKEQLHNARILLEKGYDLEDEVEPLLEQYGTVEKVPVKTAANE
jgi:hypothetical protein